MQEHGGKKELLVNLSSIDEGSEIKIPSSLNKNYQRNNSKHIQNL